MLDRMIRAIRLDAQLFQEVETDTSLNQEALMVVVLVSVIGSIGALISGIMRGDLGGALLGAIIAIVLGVVNYYIWAYVTYFVGTNLFNGTADVGEMLRTLGYAQSPRVLSLLSFIPCVGPLIALVGMLLSLAAAVIAIREALDFDLVKAILTAIIGWLIILIISAVVGAVVGVGAAGFAGVMELLSQGR